jgi:dihydrofolate reductase
VYIATSIDGFISRPDGSIDWLDAANARIPAGEDCGYAAFMATVDRLVMGRNTFDLVAGFPAWPYAGLPVHVLTSRPLSVPPALAAHKITSSDEEPLALLARLHAENVRHVYVDGGVTIQRFLRAGAVDSLIITRIPVLLGAGRPLFGPLARDVALAHRGTRAFDFGLVQDRYEVVHHGDG